MSNLYLGPLTVTQTSADFGGVSVTNVNSISVSGAPVQSTNLANKQYVDDQITTLATDRLDALLSGSTLQLDTLVEIVDYFNGLDTAASGNVSTAVANVQNNLTAEITRAGDAELALQANIDAEASRALAAENLVQANVDAEYARALAAEALLQGSIDTEALRAQNAESTLQANINAEASRATGEEDLIRGEIQTESERALAAEAALQVSIDDQIAGVHTTLNTDLSAETTRATLEEARIEAKVDAEVLRATDAEILLQTNIDTEATRAMESEGALQEALDAEIERATNAETTVAGNLNDEIGRATAAEYSILQDAIDRKRDTLVYWNPNPYIVSATDMGVVSANKPKAPTLSGLARHDGWSFTSVAATNDVVVRVQFNDTVFGEDIGLNSNILVRDASSVLVDKTTIATFNATTGKYSYLMQSNWTILIPAGSTLTLVNASVVLVSGIAHQSNLENAVYIGNSVQSIGAAVVLSADIVSNPMDWTIVPKIKPTRQSVMDIAVQLYVKTAGEFPKIKVQYANSSRTYRVPATTPAIGGYILYIGNSLWGDNVADHTNIALEVESTDGFEGYVETLVNIKLLTSGGAVTSFDINEVRVTSMLGSERMPLESSLIKHEDGSDYSSVTRTRLDALYQYFKQHDSSIHPSTGAAQ